ncbi:MAG: nitronate monooxygenase [Proteobacteria bacterium]|nr:nitronate monooxygenase [Pseudomonadota bacterium]MBU1742484.1 nitronate monooxygenase [Pseudomonadota bacterium]
MDTITGLLGCRYPVIQGAMGVISNPELVAAVSEAGGFGLLATGFITDPDELIRQIETVKALTDKPFGANLMPMNPLSRTYAGIVVDRGLRGVTLSAGSPRQLVPFLKTHGVTTFQVVASVSNALKAEALGIDAVIAEGMESGGIQSRNGVGTMVLVPAVVDAVKVPVVAAGGIADSRGFRAAMALGAKGVQIGTRFIASEECIAHEKFKRAILRADETSTSVVIDGRFGYRVITSQETASKTQETSNELPTSMARQMRDSWVGGMEAGVPFSAGQVAGLIRQIKPVSQIINELVG